MKIPPEYLVDWPVCWKMSWKYKVFRMSGKIIFCSIVFMPNEDYSFKQVLDGQEKQLGMIAAEESETSINIYFWFFHVYY